MFSEIIEEIPAAGQVLTIPIQGCAVQIADISKPVMYPLYTAGISLDGQNYTSLTKGSIYVKSGGFSVINIKGSILTAGSSISIMVSDVPMKQKYNTRLPVDDRFIYTIPASELDYGLVGDTEIAWSSLNIPKGKWELFRISARWGDGAGVSITYADTADLNFYGIRISDSYFINFQLIDVSSWVWPDGASTTQSAEIITQYERSLQVAREPAYDAGQGFIRAINPLPLIPCTYRQVSDNDFMSWNLDGDNWGELKQDAIVQLREVT